MPEFIVLGDVVRLPVLTERAPDGYRAWSPHWPGQEAHGATSLGARVKLQYALEALLARGECPVLQISP